MKKKLPNVDIVSINCVDANVSARAINYSAEFFEFGKAILITHQDIDPYDMGDCPIELHLLDKLDWDGYNDRVLNLKEHSDNDYVMLIQDDGHLQNPHLWDDDFLKYDYIGAPWPIEESWIDMQSERLRPSLRKNLPKNRVGNGGFCMRSRKFLEFSSQYDSCDGWGEDIFLCNIKYEEAIAYGIKFAPFDVALKFSYENPLTELGTSWNQPTAYDRTKHFGWHGTNFTNNANLQSIKYTTVT